MNGSQNKTIFCILILKKKKNVYPFFLGCEQKGKQLPLTEALLRSIRLHCTHLQHLALVNCRLDYHSLPLRNLPQSLVRLSLKNVQFNNLPAVRTLLNSPFVSVAKSLTNLKVILTQVT